MYKKILFFAVFVMLSLTNAANLEEIKLALIKEYKNNFPQIIIKSINLKSRSMPKDFDELKFIRLAKARFDKANGYVKAEFNDKNGILRSVFFRYFIKGNLQVLRATRAMGRGEILNASDYTLVFMDFDRVPLGALASTDDLDLITKTTIKKNAILKSNMFRKVDLIKRNDEVIGIMQDTGLNIMIELKAIEGGQIGDSIKLKNKDGKVLQGVIIDKNKVQIK